MIVAKKYSYNGGLETLERERPAELAEVIKAIEGIIPERCIDGKKGPTPLYSPKAITYELLECRLFRLGWSSPKARLGETAGFIEGDAVKNGVGLEIQFGKYAFLGWDSMRKMAALSKDGVYKFGVEIAPIAALRKRMSKGVGSYEQIVDRLGKIGNPDLGIPVVVIGVDA